MAEGPPATKKAKTDDSVNCVDGSQKKKIAYITGITGQVPPFLHLQHNLAS